MNLTHSLSATFRRPLIPERNTAMTLPRSGKPRRPLPLALSLLALTASAALASGEWAYRGTLEGNLDQGYSRTHTLTLAGGYTYYFGGSCDEDCSDLDLRLKTSSGTTVDSDTALDDEPEVSVYVPSTRRYTLQVSMEDCGWEPCHYDVEYYRRAE